jgi:hypothetical protein
MWIQLTEGVEPLYSWIEVTGDDGAAVATGKPRCARQQSPPDHQAAEAAARHLHGDLARNLGRHAQDRGKLQVHRHALTY